MEIIVNPEYEKIVPEIPEEEYESLKNSIQEKSLFHPIIINQDGIILDGHHRYKACKELGLLEKIDPQVLWRVKPFYNDLFEKEFVIESNLKRRHLLAFQRIELGEELEKIESERALRRQQSTIPDKGQKGFQPVLGS